MLKQGVTWSNGSLITSTPIKSNDGIIVGKKYFEVEILSTTASNNLVVGICGENYSLSVSPYADTNVRFYGGIGDKAMPRSSYGATYTVNNIISVLVDLDSGTIEFWKNGVSQGVAFNDVSSLAKPIYAFVGTGGSGIHSYKANFGSSKFAYKPPLGFIAYDEEGAKRLNSRVALKNPTTNQHYSLAEKTLITLPDSSPKNMILHGIEAGVEIKLDEPFDKIRAVIDNEDDTQTIVEVEVEPFSVYDYISENPQAVIYTELAEDIVVLTTTEPFDIYDELGEEAELLYYTDDETITEADLELTANWSPVDELEGDFEVVTWTDEPQETAQRVLELTAIPKPKFVKLVDAKDVTGFLDEILVEDISISYRDDARYLLSNNGNTWYSFNLKTRVFEVIDASTDSLILKNGMKAEDIKKITQTEWRAWNKDKLNIGIFLKDNPRDTITSIVDKISYTDYLAKYTSVVQDASFYILNTTAKINIELIGNMIQGVVSDDDLTRVQYRVFLNGNPHYPAGGGFTSLGTSPQNIQLSFTSNEIKIDDLNTVRVEFQDFFGTTDSWTTSFIGTYSGLMFKDVYGQYYSTEIGEVLQYLDFGTIIAGQTTIEHEVVLKNQYGYDVNNLFIYANTSEFPSALECEFSQTLSPFVPNTELRYANTLANQEEISFYIRLKSTLGATPDANGVFDIIVRADRVY